jgi:serine/threonine-protein kinase
MTETLIAGRYRLDEPLGRGGMSEVWLATDTELGRRVALKLLAPHADTARFEREARAVALLGHPHITQLYDYGEAEDDRPYMVLEYLPGGTLEDRLRAGTPLPDDETQRISAEIAGGLAHAHSRNVVHRDLKPSNVLFDEEGRAKLADFGIARMVAGEGTLTEAGTVLGTAAYISPEQASGAEATAASDVYSFGVMLYRMLTGRLPFESNDPLALINLHRSAEPPPLTEFRSDAPALLESTAAASLAKDPADRPADGTALLAALGVPLGLSTFTTATAAAAADETRVLPAAAAAAAASGPPPRPPRRSKAPLAVLLLLVLALAGGALAYALTRPAEGSTPPTTTPGLTLPRTTTHHKTTSTASSTPSTTASTQQTTTQATTTRRTTTRAPTTTAAPPTTTAAPPTTTAPPPPPTTTAAPPTTTAPPPTTTAATP